MGKKTRKVPPSRDDFTRNLIGTLAVTALVFGGLLVWKQSLPASSSDKIFELSRNVALLAWVAVVAIIWVGRSHKK